MIREVFITDLSRNLLLGHAPHRHRGADGALRTASVRINDVLLSALFSSLDSFTVTKYLADLHTHLLQFVPELTEASVRSNYFVLLEALTSPEFMPARHPPGGSVFIDIVQSVSSLQSSAGEVVRNRAFGEVFMDTLASSLDMELELKEGVAYKSPYNLDVPDAEGLSGGPASGTPVQADQKRSIAIRVNSPENRNILSFCTSKTPLYFTLHLSSNRYTFKSCHPGKFKVIEFRIPMGQRAYDVECLATRGEHRFSLTEGAVYWKFTDTEFKEESIQIRVKTISDEVHEARENVTVQFKIEGGDLPVRVVGCSNKRQVGQKFWMRSTTQSGDYEFYTE